MSLLLVRYCEIGLKSTPVRRRFENILKDNMLTMLAADGVEAIITYADVPCEMESIRRACVYVVMTPMQ